MTVSSAEFEKSISHIRESPSGQLPEIAIIGRSNVGKSSLINILVERKKLAKTSATPGKTQTINFFMINNTWRLVDLPGYGWARVSKKQKIEWSELVQDYLLKRETLCCLMVLLDIRLEPQPIDLQFLFWAGGKQIPIILVFTKADKISRNRVVQNVESYKKTLLQDWDYLPEIFISSTVDKRGKEKLLEYIESIL